MINNFSSGKDFDATNVRLYNEVITLCNDVKLKDFVENMINTK